MNSIVFFEEEISGDKVICEDDRAKYLYFIHGVRKNDDLPVSVWNKGRGRGICVESSRERVEFEIKLDLQARPHLPVRLIVGASRPQTTKKVISFCAMSGVSSVTFVGTEKSEKSYLLSKVFTEKGLREEVAKGLEQSFDCNPPLIKIERSVRTTLEGMPQIGAGESRLIAKPGSKIENTPRLSEGRSITAAIGPEAGWSSTEERHFMEAGFVPISLGDRILRVEFAAAFLLGVVSS